jgi:sulfite reductase beta subunit-like hemoprotein
VDLRRSGQHITNAMTGCRRACGDHEPSYLVLCIADRTAR